jgi:hypothetical protein
MSIRGWSTGSGAGSEYNFGDEKHQDEGEWPLTPGSLTAENTGFWDERL